MAKIGICGHFGGERHFFDGQTVKTKILYAELNNHFGKNEVIALDTYNWRKTPLKLLSGFIRLIKNTENIIILPAHNGVKVFVPLLATLNPFYKKKLHYVVVGGWLPEIASKNKYLLKHLRNFNTILVETKTMQKSLNLLGLENVSILPNFKRLEPLKDNELVANHSKPYKLCTFSRVMEEKGIEDAINAVMKVNEKMRETVYTLDIYGQIDNGYKLRFGEMLKTLPEYIRYNGIVPFDKSVEILKDYFLLLFPTFYTGEGFPGTLIDAFSAGVPVIASNWRYNTELITENREGYIFKVNDVEELSQKLTDIYQTPSDVLKMKKNCITKAKEYTPEEVLKTLIDKLDL